MDQVPPTVQGNSPIRRFAKFRISFVVIVIFLAILWFVNYTSTGPASEARNVQRKFMAAQVDIGAEQVRRWALDQMAQRPAQVGEPSQIPLEVVPDFLRRLFSVEPAAMVVNEGVGDSNIFVQLDWSGHFGHSFLRMGSTNFQARWFSEGTRRGSWAPGIYFEYAERIH